MSIVTALVLSLAAAVNSFPASVASPATSIGALYTYGSVVCHRCFGGYLIVNSIMPDGTLQFASSLRAGKGAYGHFQQGTSAVLVHGKNLFVLDSYGSSILRFNINSADATNVTLAESAQFVNSNSGPAALTLSHHPTLPVICAGAFGGLYNDYNPTVYCLTYASGSLSPLTTLGSSHPYLAFSGDGNYLVATNAISDIGGVTPTDGLLLYKISNDNGAVSFNQVATATGIAATSLLAVGQSSFLVTQSPNTVALFTASGSTLSNKTIAFESTSSPSLSDTLFCSDARKSCYIVGGGPGNSVNLHVLSGTGSKQLVSNSVISVPTSKANLEIEGGIAVEANGSVYGYLLGEDLIIYAISLDAAGGGSVTQAFAIPKPSTHFGLPEGLAFSLN